MLPEFTRARISAILCGAGLIMRLLTAHPELYPSDLPLVFFLIYRAFGTGLMVIGFLLMILYLIEGILAMRRVKVEVKKSIEEKPMNHHF